MLFIAGSGALLQAQQLNMPNYDSKKKIHFGFTLALNSNDFRLRMHENFLNIDTLQRVSIKRFPGFILGGIANWRINDNFDLRVLPSIAFAQRNISYTFVNPANNRTVKIESVYLEVPLLIKFKTKRFRNHRFYTIAGVKYSYDLASNIDANRSLADPVVAVYPNSLSYEVGCGLDIYFPYFKFSPEIKLTNSFTNVLVKDGYVYTEAFDGLWSRIFNFSFHFE